MFRVDHKDIRALATGALLALSLAACAQSGAQPMETPVASVAPTVAPATPTLAAVASVAPTVAPVTPTPAPVAAEPTPAATALPALVSIDQGRVVARSGIEELAELASVPAGALGAMLAGNDTLLVVTEGSIERVRLSDGATEQVATFDRPALFGVFRAHGGRVFYDVKVSELESVTPFGVGTRIGSYDIATGLAQPILAEPSSLELLGVTSDGSLLTLPRGQDPGFGVIQLRSPSDGAILERLDVPGEGYALVSPDGRWAAVSSRRYEGDQGAGVDELRLYDLSVRPLTSRLVSLPQPGAANAGVWSADGSRFFFSYGPGNLYELSGSYGLWQLDRQTAEVRLVAEVEVQSTRIDGISPAGFVLLRSLTTDSAMLVDTTSGAQNPTIVSPSAFVAGWR